MLLKYLLSCSICIAALSSQALADAPVSTENKPAGSQENSEKPAAPTGTAEAKKEPQAQPHQVDDEVKARKFKAQLHAFEGGKLLKQRQFYYAAKEFKQASDLDPENIQYTIGFANSAHQASTWDEAVEAYKRIVKADPSHTEVYKTIGECLVKLAKYDEAVDAYKKSLPYEKDKADIWVRIAAIRTGQARHGEAMDAYRQAIKAAPNEGKAYRLLAAMQWNAGNKADAMATYREGVAKASKDGDLKGAFAYALMSNQQWREAAEAYKAAAQLKGSMPELQSGYKSAMEHVAYEEQIAKRKAELEAKKHHRH